MNLLNGNAMHKAFFLDRDGVINKDKVDYVYRLEDFYLLADVDKALTLLKESGYLLIVITNQSGIDKGIYTAEDVNMIHNHIQYITNNMIDAFYYAPYARQYTNSLARKPGTLMFEKAIARFNIDASRSYMIGDRKRDLDPALDLGITPIMVESEYQDPYEGLKFNDLYEAARHITFSA